MEAAGLAGPRNSPIPVAANRTVMRQSFTALLDQCLSNMACVVTAIAGHALHFRRRHTRAFNQVVNVGIAVVITGTMHAIVIVLSAGVTGVCGNLLDEPLDLFRCSIAHDLAFASIIQIVSALIEHGLLVFIRCPNRMNSYGAERTSHAGNHGVLGKTYVGVVEMANAHVIQEL